MNTDIRDRRLDRSWRQTRGASIRPSVLAVGAALFILLALQMLPSGTPPLHAQGSGGGNSAPVFGESEYVFTVGENASIGSVVGTVSASDVDAGDTLSYSIVSGNEGVEIAMVVSTGALMVVSSLDYETTRRYAMTVQVSDGSGGTATAAVSVEVTNVLDVCLGGVAVTNPGTTNTGLAGDCEVLLVAKDTLQGGASGPLNWRKDTAIGSWVGVTVSGTPNRVTVPGSPLPHRCPVHGPL